MKPKLFIGSSVESLKTANAIQENLEYDAEVTVWNQGIFQLSKGALESLIEALEKFDFAVFVFEPNDVTRMRKSELNTVRDNVVFEFGLFIGRLGRNRVFFVTPRNSKELHLPSDLLGITAGTYDADHSNIRAALGPFCNQVREELQKFVYVNLEDLAVEKHSIKKIAVERPDGWEFKLASALIKDRFAKINEGYAELDRGVRFKKTKRLNIKEFYAWYADTLNDFIRLMNLFKSTFDNELMPSFGAPGEPGDIKEMRRAVDHLYDAGSALLEWESELQSIRPPENVVEAKEIMKDWSKIITSEIEKFPKAIDEFFDGNPQPDAELRIHLRLETPSTVDKVSKIISKAFNEEYGLSDDEDTDEEY